jgi:hypothetical protein
MRWPYLRYNKQVRNPLIHALNAPDNSRTTIYASDPSLLNARAHLGYTPLHFAAHVALYSGTSILNSHGTLTNIRGDKELSPLLTVIELDQPRSVQLLPQTARIFIPSMASVKSRLFTLLVLLLLVSSQPSSLSSTSKAVTNMPSRRGMHLQLACRIGSPESA